jgi:hypothetical protein
MSARSAYRPSQACSSVRTPAVARKADHSPADSLHPASPVASSTPRRRSGRRRAAAQPSMMSPLERFLALQAPREPQMGANVFSPVPGLNTIQSECSRRPEAPRSTQSDDARHQDPPGTSLTRKRSLVQIQYGPRHFSKSCLVMRAQMRASDLGFCPITAGQSVPRETSSPGLCSASDLSLTQSSSPAGPGWGYKPARPLLAGSPPTGGSW